MSLEDPLKLHVRTVPVHRRLLHVVTLRPTSKTRFSTNYFHDTWHILGDADGAALFGRLLWGLAFQRRPGTLLMIDAPHVTTTPFEGDAPDPIVVVPAGVTKVEDDTLRALRLRLRRSPMPPKTIRWHTFGMPAAIEDTARWARGGTYSRPEQRRLRTREFVSRRGGYICMTLPPALLREHGADIYAMSRRGSGYHPIAESRRDRGWSGDGEFQLIGGFDTLVSAARTARAAIAPDRRDRLADSDIYRDIYDRAYANATQLRQARRATTMRRRAAGT